MQPVLIWIGRHPRRSAALAILLVNLFGSLLVAGLVAYRPAARPAAPTVIPANQGVAARQAPARIRPVPASPVPAAPVKAPPATPLPAKAPPVKALQGMSVKDYIARPQKELTVVYGLVQLNQVIRNGPGQNDTMTIYIWDADKTDALSCELFLNSAEGRRLHYLLQDGSMRPMTVKVSHGPVMASWGGIVSEK
jgi:hypothetical protein